MGQNASAGTGGYGPPRAAARKGTKTSRMVLVTGWLKKPEETEEQARKAEVWVETKPGATVGWVLSQTMKEMAKKEPDIPAIVGLRIVKAADQRTSAPSPAAAPMPGAPIGQEDEVDSVTAGMIIDYGQSIDELLVDGDVLECIFEVPEERQKASGEWGSPARQQNVTVNDFTIVRVLGMGASSRVVQVKHKGNGKYYAVKVMSKRKIVTHEKKLERAIAEKRLLAKLSHPFIVSMEYAFQTKGHLFLVLDYCPGGELFFHLQQKGKFAETDSRFYISEIVTGLEYLHLQGVLYRDLKPENCLLDDQGHVRLTDFGLSKENLTQSAVFQSFVGTVLYLSPEMIRREAHGLAMDFYCLGCLVYVLLTGRIPHFTNDVSAMCRDRAAGKEIIWPTKDVSPEGIDLMKSLLKHDPGERLGTRNNQGAMEVKEHPWFREVDFLKVYRKERQPIFPNFPPIDPRSTQGCFSSEFTNVPVPSQLMGFGSTVAQEEQTIAGFSTIDQD